MSTIPERIQVALDRKGMSWSKSATSIGLSAQAATKWKKGQIGKETLQDLAELLTVNYGWLATGQGEMTAKPTLQSNVNPNFQPISDWDDDTPIEPNEFAIPFYKDFSVACGHGSASMAYNDEWRRLRMSRATIDRIGSYKDKVFATLADGDSMSPTINDGDTIWVDMSKETIKDGKIFVFEYGGLFMCKRLYRLPNNGLRVVSDNADVYPEWEITGEEREQNGFRLIGWVWHWSVMERW